MTRDDVKILDAVLLLALPASGKSEVRRYIDHVPDDVRARDFRMGPTVQLDDYPYVHAMRRVDDELAALGDDRFFFCAPDRPFRDPRHWGTLVECVNEDYDDLVARRRADPASAGRHLLERLDAAARRAGATALLRTIDDEAANSLARALDKEARAMLDEKHANQVDSLAGKTLVIEFARGGPEGASMPLPAPLGYAHSAALLSPAILEKAAVLYVWVEPEESKRKNRARTKPGADGSILHHGVPEEVMRADYGCDDIAWLMENSGRPGTIAVKARGRTFHLPACRFDNRVDKTSFLRDDAKDWKPSDVKAVHEGLRAAVAALP